MKASVGDRMVVNGVILGQPPRDGKILTVEGPDGGAPYLVQWSDNGRKSLFFPGPGAHVEPYGNHGQARPGHPSGESAAEPPGHAHSWQVDVYLDDSQGRTTAHAVLHTEAAVPLDGRGTAQRGTEDDGVPEVGDEIATARALQRLADHLLATAADDLAALRGGGPAA